MLEHIDNSQITSLFSKDFTFTFELIDKRQYTYTLLEYTNTDKLYQVLYWSKCGDDSELVRIGYFNYSTKEFIPIDKFKEFSSIFWPKHMRYILLVLSKLNKLDSKFKIYKGVPDDY